MNNYQKGIQYEFGIDQPQDYKKAYGYYLKALEDNSDEARKKVKYSRFSIHQLVSLIMVVIVGILIDVFSVYPWMGIFLISSVNIVIPLFFSKESIG